MKNASLDIKNEACFLHLLKHPNIIKIHGTCGGTPGSPTYSLLLERKNCTLETQCKEWRKMKNKMMINVKSFLFGNSARQQFRAKLWNKQLSIAIDLASTMKYIHSKNIIFRDLKPSNCGIDMNGDIKLFDFGLATNLPSELKVGENKFKLTANTGTQRYMSPEVARSMPYGKPADVFSFAILLWELLSLNTAFKEETIESHARKVYGYRNHRPTMKIGWPRTLQHMIGECWDLDSSKRPQFIEVHLNLRRILFQ